MKHISPFFPIWIFFVPHLWGVTHDAYTKELEFGPTYWNANHFPSAFFSCSMEPGIIQRGEPATSK
jgi:hypothetical protein